MLGRKMKMQPGTGRGRGTWLVLGFLLAAALVPAACVLWFMNAAMTNARLAVRQTLTDVYHQKVQADRSEIAALWSSRTTVSAADEQPPAAFERLAASGMFSGGVVLDPAGRPVYPQPTAVEAAASAEPTAAWRAAADLEYDERDYPAAA